MERIYPDDLFIDTAFSKATEFFKNEVLPELLGKWYSKTCTTCPLSTTSNFDKSNDENMPPPSSSVTWCYCKGEEMGEMIGCDSESCPIQWFHTACLKMKHTPTGKRFCPECTKKL